MKPSKQNFLTAIINAAVGLYRFFKNERNGQIQIRIVLIITLAGFYFCINTTEWLAILICVALVLSFEMINSTLEKLADIVDPNYNLSIKTIKDIAAAAVLWSALISIIVGGIIFIPKIIGLLSQTFH